MEPLQHLQSRVVEAWDAHQAAHAQWLVNPTIENAKAYHRTFTAYCALAKEWDRRMIIMAQVGE